MVVLSAQTSLCDAVRFFSKGDFVGTIPVLRFIPVLSSFSVDLGDQMQWMPACAGLLISGLL
jgi:hypothetical protein